MRRKVLVGIIFSCLAVGIFSGATNVSAEGGEFVATVIDTADSETQVYNLKLYGEKEIDFKKGESTLTIPFSNIKEMEFIRGETPTGTITLLSGEKIKGEPRYYYFSGKTDYGSFNLYMPDTKKVIFLHAIASISPTPVTTTHIIPTSMQASSPDETMPPCEKGYKDCYPPWGDCETNIYEDKNNCGDCGIQCPEGYFCLYGSIVPDTTANKEKLATYYKEQCQRYDGEKKYEEAKNYLLKAKDVYIDINRPDQVREIDAFLEEVEEKILKREIFELVLEIAIAVILAVFFGYLFDRKTKKVPLWVVVASSAAVFFIVFLVLRLWILPIFY